ncbi:uncharacterized protein Ecym_3321 [Eremothecium cymbalariae DBVPG|uniref:Uncharacterized protein n=1 Tax=Eremothecium cymbalariae (strain CBS 270.75 / DBVPG 7215 / KCTC 17166 / NRRL Y-17582) TaxID=931890 RepID=G8JRP3_ERECY|nr:Hypothetical protein Ecym_3321 [Eremothecium cymbalariae DBVPG\
MSYTKCDTISFGSDNWCLKLQPLYSRGLLSALSNGHVHLIDWNSLTSIQDIPVHGTSISALKVLDNDVDSGNTFVTASEDSVKIFDLRLNQCVATVQNAKNSPFISLDSRHGMLACGTELSGTDAEIHLYDLKKIDAPMRSFCDSHHDDITDIKFHASDPSVLLSGSTDGYVNVYDLKQQEEEEALHQVINFASIHSCGWLSPKRIWALSHMETFSIHELNDKSDELVEPKPLEFGDIRKPWNCDYVVDIFPGCIITGSTQEQSMLQLLPFSNEEVDTTNSIIIPRAHGDEVVRDALIHKTTSELFYSGGEDGNIVLWKSNRGSLNVPTEFWNYQEKLNVLHDPNIEIDMTVEKDIAFESEHGIPTDFNKTPETEAEFGIQKESKRRNHTHDRNNEKKRKLKSHRFTPY